MQILFCTDRPQSNSCKFVATVELTGSNADDFTFADGANVYTGYVNNVQ